MNDKPQNSKLRARGRFWVILAVLLPALATIAALYCGRHTVSPEQLSRIRPGMTKSEVIKLLGTPFGSSQQSGGLTMLAYRKQDRWCMVDIFLGADGRVVSVFHDH